MIEKSLFLVSIISSIFGFSVAEERIDDAVYRLEYRGDNNVVASALDEYLPEIIKTPEININAPNANIRANNFLLADMESGKVMLKKSDKMRVPIASITKIMTALVVLDEYNLSDIVTVSADATYQIGADAFLRVGEKMSVYEMLHCLLIKSGNDSAYALAEHANEGDNSGIDRFVSLMNKKATELGMDDTKYKDPAGLDVSGYSTAYDLLVLTREALKNKTFRNIVRIKKYVAKSADSTTYHELKNSNRLIGEYNYMGAIGIKTGYMPEAGHCLVSAATREGHTLIGIVLHTYLDTVTASADESVRLLDWGFNNINWH